MKTQLYTLRTLTGLHCGAGHGLADIDLPVVRDPVTHHPYAPGSSLKGVLRDDPMLSERKFAPEHAAVFGPPNQPAPDGQERTIESASCVAFGDARLVCLPTRSFHGTFAYLTSPVALHLLAGDLKQASWLPEAIPAVPSLAQGLIALPPQSDLRRPSKQGNSNPPASPKVLLEEFSLDEQASHAGLAAQWLSFLRSLLASDTTFDAQLFTPRFGIVCDAVFDFLCESALPVALRNALSSEGTTRDQALWSEEFVPAEAIFAGLLHAEDSRRQRVSAEKALEFVQDGPRVIQLGGKATTGRGLVALSYPQPNPLSS